MIEIAAAQRPRDELVRLFGHQPFRLPGGTVTGAGLAMLAGSPARHATPGEEHYDAFVAASEGQARMYEDLLAATSTALGSLEGLSYADVSCNAGYFCYRALQLGAATATGFDARDFGPCFEILNAQLGVDARFVQTRYDMRAHRLEPDPGERFDVVSSIAFLSHASDPTFLLDHLAGLADRALLLYAKVLPGPDYVVRYGPATSRYFREPYPLCFDSATEVSEGLLRFALGELGFAEVLEVPRQRHWVPAGGSWRAFLALRPDARGVPAPPPVDAPAATAASAETAPTVGGARSAAPPVAAGAGAAPSEPGPASSRPAARDVADGRDRAALRAELGARLAQADALAARRRGAGAAQELYVSIVRDLRPPDARLDLALDADGVRRAVGSAPIWHSIDLGHDWIDGRRKTAAVLSRELLAADLPDLAGKRVLDVGAWGGFFSFEAAHRGARVTALDWYSWVTDFPALHAWMNAERQAGREPSPYALPESCLDREGCPGRRPFDVVNAALGAPVATIVAPFEQAELPVFDVVFHFGVLYHCEDPMLTCRKLAAVTGETAVVETLAYHDPLRPAEPLWKYFGADEVNHDPTTWWAPSATGLSHMLKAAGFADVRVTSGPESIPARRSREPQLYRIWVHATK